MRDINSLSIAIDASRNRSGGAQTHLIGIISSLDVYKHRVEKVHVWAFKSLLDLLPECDWLVKHNPPALEGSLFRQLVWQATALANEVKLANCKILFSTDASTLCRFKNMVVLSQDMLSYEHGVMDYFGYSFARIRLLAILLVQNLSFRRASGVIFLTNYASKVIQESCGSLPTTTCIPHGVDKVFRQASINNNWPTSNERPIRCIYVSNAEMYKHQWEVIKAISQLRECGYNLNLLLVGGGRGSAQKLIHDAIKDCTNGQSFTKQLDFLPHHELSKLLAESDIFIFASSCENMPVTLVEAMAVGLPIACSDRGPMPEILVDGGVYFNPEDCKSIAYAIKQIIDFPELRLSISRKSRALSEKYSWERCSDETFTFIRKFT